MVLSLGGALVSFGHVFFWLVGAALLHLLHLAIGLRWDIHPGGLIML